MKIPYTISFLFFLLTSLLVNAQSTNKYWHTVNTPSDSIHFVEDLNDTLYGLTLVGNTVEVRRRLFNTWMSIQPISLAANENYKQLVKYKNELYALTSNRLLKYSGSSWTTVLNQSFLEKMIVFRNRLLLHGGFSSFQGNTAYGFIYYDGASFGVLKYANNQVFGFTGTLNDWLVFNNKLYLGGDIYNTSAGQIPSDLLIWNDSTVVEAYVATTNNPIVKDIHVFNGEVYIVSAKGYARKVYKLNGSSLVDLNSFAHPNLNVVNSDFGGLSHYNNQLVISGFVADTFTYFYTTLAYNGSNWESLGDSIYPYSSIIRYNEYFKPMINSAGVLYRFGKINRQKPFVFYRDTNLVSLEYSVTDALPDSCYLKDARYFLSKKISMNNNVSRVYSSSKGVSTVEIPANQIQGLHLKLSEKEISYYQPLACSDSIIPVIKNSAGTYEAHFFVKPIVAINDVKVTVSGETGWRARQGFKQNYYIDVSNVGTEPLTNVTTNFSFSSNSIVVNSSDVPTSAQATNLTFLIDSLNVGEQRTIRVKLENTLGYVIGDSIQFTAQASIAQVDADSTNNTYSLNQLVTAAVDPNSKKVNREAITSWGGPLRYQINFQNFGNDTAYTVVIVDTLSLSLKRESFELVSSSHPVEFELMGNVIVFRFKNILLVDSASNADASKGFVQFDIDMKSQLAKTDTIKNRAHIYFDFQPAVITNYAKTYRMSQVGISENQKRKFKIFPNPSSGMLTIATKTPGVFTLYNNLGQEVWRGQINLEPISLNLEHLPAGLYFIVNELGASQKMILSK